MPAIWIPKRLVDIDIINIAVESEEKFIRHCEIEYEGRVRAAAEEIVQSGCKIVMLTGPSASGKTTTSHKLSHRIREMGVFSRVISMDDFFKNLEDYPRLEDGSKDYENVTAVDVTQLIKCMQEIIDKGHTKIPQFDFLTEHRREEWQDVAVGDGVIVVEGIHALNPIVTETLPKDEIYKVYAGLREEYAYKGERVLPTKDIRLARRLVRDYKFRGHSPEKTISMWPAVCKGENEFIKIFKKEADLLLDTSFSYEICALAPIIKETFEAIDKESEHLERMKILMQAFEHCRTICLEGIPKNSMLQEFLNEK